MGNGTEREIRASDSAVKGLRLADRVTEHNLVTKLGAAQNLIEEDIPGGMEQMEKALEELGDYLLTLESRKNDK